MKKVRIRRQIKKLLKKSSQYSHYTEQWHVPTKTSGIIYVTRKEVDESGINIYDLFMRQGLYP